MVTVLWDPTKKAQWKYLMLICHCFLCCIGPDVELIQYATCSQSLRNTSVVL